MVGGSRDESVTVLTRISLASMLTVSARQMRRGFQIEFKCVNRQNSGCSPQHSSTSSSKIRTSATKNVTFFARKHWNSFSKAKASTAQNIHTKHSTNQNCTTLRSS